MHSTNYLRLQVFLIIAFIFSTNFLIAQKSELKLKVSPDNPSLDVGETLQLMVKIVDNDGNKVEREGLRYFSRAAKIASVDEKGLITAHKGGEAGNSLL